MKRTLLIAAILLIFQSGYAKDKYWIFFSDKEVKKVTHVNVSEKAILNRNLLGLELNQFSDQALDRNYLNFLSANHIKVVCRSKWLNAVSAYLNQDEIRLLKETSFVKDMRLINSNSVLASSSDTETETDNFALEQINSKAIEKEDLTGKNVVIGVIDGHFWKSKQNVSLQPIFNDKRVLGTKDFVESADHDNFFDRGTGNNDTHGTLVWQFIAGFDKDKRKRYGLATRASFYLARTDDSRKEFRKEEDYLVSALEWMDSLGVRLVNTSLAYSADYDNPLENYKPENMNGVTSSIAKAVSIAVREKGMIIVIAAGNEGGNRNWKYISTPADAAGAIAVGSTDKHGQKAVFSGIGPPFLSYVKPDIACYSNHGTSFSAPVITGLVACLLEKNPRLTSADVNQLLQKSGNLYPYSNNYLGSGVPDAGRIMQLVNLTKSDWNNVEEIRVKENKVVLSTKKYKSKIAVVFHKENERTVTGQTIVFPEDNQFVIQKESGVKRSTVVLNNRVTEIYWE